MDDIEYLTMVDECLESLASSGKYVAIPVMALNLAGLETARRLQKAREELKSEGGK